jgi:hypothetical protein
VGRTIEEVQPGSSKESDRILDKVRAVYEGKEHVLGGAAA